MANELLKLSIVDIARWAETVGVAGLGRSVSANAVLMQLAARAFGPHMGLATRRHRDELNSLSFTAPSSLGLCIAQSPHSARLLRQCGA